MSATDSRELLTFYLGEALCGLEIGRVEEISRPLALTPVPQAPPGVLGLVNVRGKIVTVLDLVSRVGLKGSAASRASRVIFVRCGGESLGLMVDRVAEVVAADQGQVTAAPANLKGTPSQFFAGVLQTGQGLIGLLNLDTVLGTRREAEGTPSA